MLEVVVDREIGIFAHLSAARDWLSEQGYNCVYLSVHGSQNYGLDTPESDFDFTAVVVPTLRDMIWKQDVSINREYNGGIIEVMDIRKWVRNLGKCNPSYLEALVTPYYVCRNDMQALFHSFRSCADDLIQDGSVNFAYSVSGHFKQLLDRYENKYPERGKLYAHAVRMVHVLEVFYKEETFDITLPDDLRQHLIDVKRNNHVSPEEVAELKENMSQLMIALTKYPVHTKSDATYQYLCKLVEQIFDMEVRRLMLDDNE